MNKLYKDLNLKASSKIALEKLGIEMMTEIQELVIPKMIEGNDIIAQAQTGTGKTFAFAVPIMEKIDPRSRDLEALIICPTRELARQVYNEFKKLNSDNSYNITVIYGGDSYNKQFNELKRGPQIVIATPGRVIDHLNRGTIDFSKVQTLVLDEADEMLKMGFLDDLETIFKAAPKDKQTTLFSATMSNEIKRIAKNYQKNAIFLRAETQTLTVDKIDQSYYMVKKRDRNNLLIRLLDFYPIDSAIIFCNTKADVDNLVEYLQKNNYQASAIHGDLSQKEREVVMKRFREKRLNYLVATDVAARGIDIKHIDYVINYEVPFENELYVHRIGRTGRAGKKGTSITFAYPSTISRLRGVERYIKTDIKELGIPDVADINKRKKVTAFNELTNIIINNNTENNVTEFKKHLEEHNLSDEDIINGLINQFLLKEKDYGEIDSLKNKKTNESKQKGKRAKMSFALYQINVGSQQGIKPPALLDLIKKHADLFNRNIGDIKISKNETTFEVNKTSTRRIEKLNNKFFNGKQIKLKKI